MLANDVVPGMGMPVAAPGLRAWGLAEGLRGLGHEVLLAVDAWAVGQAWRGAVPPPRPRGCVVLAPRQVSTLARTRGFDRLVITNSNHIDRIGDLGRCQLVYDFFAPKMLELAENVGRADQEAAMASLRERKLQALGRSSAIIVNGAKKLDYAREWAQLAGRAEVPMAVVNPGLPPLAPDPAPTDRLQIIVSGYLQPWSRPGAWVEAVLPLMDAGLVDLHLIVGEHWASRYDSARASDLIDRLATHPRAVRHGLLDFEDFRRLLSRCHVNVDVFERNPERELAMVTRSLVALSAGLPTMHVDFTEVSPWIAEHDAGWLVPEGDVTSVREILRSVAVDRSLLDAKRAGARSIAENITEPRVAAAPLDRLLRRGDETSA